MNKIYSLGKSECPRMLSSLLVFGELLTATYAICPSGSLQIWGPRWIYRLWYLILTKCVLTKWHTVLKNSFQEPTD